LFETAKIDRSDAKFVGFRDILRWGKNVGSVKTRSTRRAGVAVYNKASSLETLVSLLKSETHTNLYSSTMRKTRFSSVQSDWVFVSIKREKTGRNDAEARILKWFFNRENG
jgi:hypothetical protein